MENIIIAVIFGGILLTVLTYIVKQMRGGSDYDENLELLRTNRGQNTVKDRSRRDS